MVIQSYSIDITFWMYMVSLGTPALLCTKPASTRTSCDGCHLQGHPWLQMNGICLFLTIYVWFINDAMYHMRLQFYAVLFQWKTTEGVWQPSAKEIIWV